MPIRIRSRWTAGSVPSRARVAALEAARGYRIAGRVLTLTDGGGQTLAVLEEATLR